MLARDAGEDEQGSRNGEQPSDDALAVPEQNPEPNSMGKSVMPKLPPPQKLQ